MAISKSTSNVGKADFLTWYVFCYGQERFCNILKTHILRTIFKFFKSYKFIYPMRRLPTM